MGCTACKQGAQLSHAGASEPAVPGAVLSIIMVVYLWGSCIAYLVIIGDSFSPLLELAAGAPPESVCIISEPVDSAAPLWILKSVHSCLLVTRYTGQPCPCSAIT
jgi:hypothetical protein